MLYDGYLIYTEVYVCSLLRACYLSPELLCQHLTVRDGSIPVRYSTYCARLISQTLRLIPFDCRAKLHGPHTSDILTYKYMLLQPAMRVSWQPDKLRTYCYTVQQACGNERTTGLRTLSGILISEPGSV